MSWLGADAPLLESDIRSLVDNHPLKFSGRRVTQFLETRGLLIPDAEVRRDAHQKRLEAELAALPAAIAQELSVWIKAVRGEGTWEHTGRTYRSIARYWHVLDPILKGWLADGIESLREITRDDVKRAIATRKGTPARSIHIVLRNVFRALRQEGVIFRDPTRGLVFAGINTTPPSVPSDRLADVLSHARNDFQRFVMVLVCVHALSGTDMRHLLLTDLDLSRERLIVRRPGKRHIIYLGIGSSRNRGGDRERDQDREGRREGRTHLPLRLRLAPRTAPPLAGDHQPTSADQPMDRSRHHPLTHRHHLHRYLPAHRTDHADAATGPNPPRGIRGRRPAPPDAPVRQLRSDRDAVHHRGPPRTHREATPMR
ncbi:hypothetical protein ABTZ58_35750 [Streptomyces sp. NPDC094143]|uniref:hypothetical protein n=1 Tax=Streptomyces sp. NPDC094143 TaxID=3155310 RepID=UPI00331EA002